MFRKLIGASILIIHGISLFEPLELAIPKMKERLSDAEKNVILSCIICEQNKRIMYEWLYKGLEGDSNDILKYY